MAKLRDPLSVSAPVFGENETGLALLKSYGADMAKLRAAKKLAGEKAMEDGIKLFSTKYGASWDIDDIKTINPEMENIREGWLNDVTSYGGADKIPIEKEFEYQNKVNTLVAKVGSIKSQKTEWDKVNAQLLADPLDETKQKYDHDKSYLRQAAIKDPAAFLEDTENQTKDPDFYKLVQSDYDETKTKNPDLDENNLRYTFRSLHQGSDAYSPVKVTPSEKPYDWLKAIQTNVGQIEPTTLDFTTEDPSGYKTVSGKTITKGDSILKGSLTSLYISDPSFKEETDKNYKQELNLGTTKAANIGEYLTEKGRYYAGKTTETSVTYTVPSKSGWGTKGHEIEVTPKTNQEKQIKYLGKTHKVKADYEWDLSAETTGVKQLDVTTDIPYYSYEPKTGKYITTNLGKKSVTVNSVVYAKHPITGKYGTWVDATDVENNELYIPYTGTIKSTIEQYYLLSGGTTQETTPEKTTGESGITWKKK